MGEEEDEEAAVDEEEKAFAVQEDGGDGDDSGECDNPKTLGRDVNARTTAQDLRRVVNRQCLGSSDVCSVVVQRFIFFCETERAPCAPESPQKDAIFRDLFDGALFSSSGLVGVRHTCIHNV